MVDGPGVDGGASGCGGWRAGVGTACSDAAFIAASNVGVKSSGAVDAAGVGAPRRTVADDSPVTSIFSSKPEV